MTEHVDYTTTTTDNTSRLCPRCGELMFMYWDLNVMKQVWTCVECGLVDPCKEGE